MRQIGDREREMTQVHERQKVNRRQLLEYGVVLGVATPLALSLRESALAAQSDDAATQQITIGQGVEPETLDIQQTDVGSTRNVAGLILEPLVIFDYNAGELTGTLAESWSTVDDLNWEVKLKPGIQFTNGEPLDAEAVKFAIERFLTGTHPFASRLAKLELTVTPVDETTVRLTTNAPYPFVMLDATRIPIVPPGYLGEVGDSDFALNPVGTGPYTLKEWIAGDRVTLEKSESYRGDGFAFGEVVYRAIPEAASRTAALQTGEVDAISSVSLLDFETIDADSNLDAVAVVSNRSMFVRFDCEDPRLSDVRVRQAFNYAVDKELLVSALLLGNGEVLDGQPIGRQIVGHNDALQAYPYDPDKARQLLEEAGFDFDTPMTMFTTSGRYTADQDISQAIAGMLSEVGVQLDVQPLEWGVWLSKYRDGSLTPLTFVGIHTSVPDAFTLLDTHSSASIGGKFKNPDYDAIMNEAASTIDPDARIELYNQASQLLHDEAGLLFLYQQYDIYASNRDVAGINFRPDDAIDLSQAVPAS